MERSRRRGRSATGERQLEDLRAVVLTGHVIEDGLAVRCDRRRRRGALGREDERGSAAGIDGHGIHAEFPSAASAVEYAAIVRSPDRVVIRVTLSAEGQARQRAAFDVERPYVLSALGIRNAVGDQATVRRQAPRPPHLPRLTWQRLGRAGAIRPRESRPVLAAAVEVRQQPRARNGIVAGAWGTGGRNVLDNGYFTGRRCQAGQIERHGEKRAAPEKDKMAAFHVSAVDAAADERAVSGLVEFADGEHRTGRAVHGKQHLPSTRQKLRPRVRRLAFGAIDRRE